MKIEIENNNGAVISACMFDNEHAFNLIIDTNVYDGFFTAHWNDAMEYCFCIKGCIDTGNVKIIAENEHDIEIIKRVRFICEEKGQLHVIFPRDELIDEGDL